MLLFRNKSGVSVIIGYVLLIVGTIVMSGVIYGWLQSYVPQETLECPGGVSLFIKDVECKLEGNKYILSLNISNNGRFYVNGYFIKSAETANQQIATKDISEKIIQGATSNAGLVLFSGQSLDPNKNAPQAKYELDKEIYLIELVPIRYEIVKNKNRLISCGDAKIKEKIICH